MNKIILVLLTILISTLFACASHESTTGKIARHEALLVGQQYMAENRKKETVKTTKSGLQYRVIRAGYGDKPSEYRSVSVHYSGKFINGTEFDSSYKLKQPATFALKNVIRGWREGIQLMRVGAKYEFVIPPKLAYGSRGTSSGSIGPNETLIFEVELLEIL